MGLQFFGASSGFAFLYREARVDVQKPGRNLGAYIMGLAFGFGLDALHRTKFLAPFCGCRPRAPDFAARRLSGGLGGRFCWWRWPLNPLSGVQAVPALFRRDRCGHWRSACGDGNSLP